MPLSKDYYINTEKDGVLGKTTKEDVDRLFEILRTRERIVLHIHGGLVNEASGMQGAEALVELYRDAGAHPVFFIWESGLIEVVSRHLPEIVGEELFKSIRKKVLKWAVGKIRGAVGLTAGAALPSDAEIVQELSALDRGAEPFGYLVAAPTTTPVTGDDELAIAQDLAADPAFQATLQAIADEAFAAPIVSSAVRTRASARTLASPEIVAEIQEDVTAAPVTAGIALPRAALRAGKILFRVVRRMINGRHHGFYNTAIEEILREFYVANIGSKVWAAMKNETSDTFDPDPQGRIRGGRYFLDKLEILLQQLSPERWPSITLVGHSAGAEFVNNLLQQTRIRRQQGSIPAQFRYAHVIFEAPACTFRQVHSMLRQCSDLFGHLRIFAMSDDRERADVLVPFLYLSSLLYFVSGVVEVDDEGEPEADVPLLGMQRYHDRSDVYKDTEVVALRQYVAADDRRTVWAPADRGDGLRCDARRHGGVDNDAQTVASVQHIIRAGIPDAPVVPVAAHMTVTASGVAAAAAAPNEELARIYRAFGVSSPVAAAAAATAGGNIPATASMDSGTDVEPMPLTLSTLEALEQQLDVNPDRVVSTARDLFGPDITEENLRQALAQARLILTQPERHVVGIEMLAAAADSQPPLPPGFTFDGIDLARIPINYESHQFETTGDLLSWIFVSGPRLLFRGQRSPFRAPESSPTSFSYPLRDATAAAPLRLALMADFGTGLYHARYIAAQLERDPVECAIHLGDVYYNGSQSEFAEHMDQPLGGILNSTELFSLNSNHEMLSGGRWYFDFLDRKRAGRANQRQEGSLFSLANRQVQIVAIDTDYEGGGRVPEKHDSRAWLRTRLLEGRAAGRITVLLTANHPYEYGKEGRTKLWQDDLDGIIREGLVDVWFWGNTHYCALFDRTADGPFIGSCIGHAGYPYGVKRRGKAEPAPVRFLETEHRFPGFDLRKDMGNNGYVRMNVTEDGLITLNYIDWMNRPRCEARLRRNAPGVVAIESVHEGPRA